MDKKPNVITPLTRVIGLQWHVILSLHVASAFGQFQHLFHAPFDICALAPTPRFMLPSYYYKPFYVLDSKIL